VRPTDRGRASLTVAALVLLAGVAGALTGGCSDPPKTGVVQSKRDVPAHDYTTYVQGSCTVWSRVGTQQVCVAHQSIPIFHHVDEAYELCLLGDADESGRRKSGCRAVGHEDYVHYAVGQRYP
jgi:hypothetical protein